MPDVGERKEIQWKGLPREGSPYLDITLRSTKRTVNHLYHSHPVSAQTVRQTVLSNLNWVSVVKRE